MENTRTVYCETCREDVQIVITGNVDYTWYDYDDHIHVDEEHDLSGDFGE